MSAKRALIVDDSKSARAFLARILEKYEMAVDTAENAEQAIEYLAAARPDVIFMDHMMPGMDGFQAVQSIKNNPRTAMIPIMMYTSQEGELYLGQARALGAMGVLPKQIKPADVSKVLYQLHLAPDRRLSLQEGFTPLNPAASVVVALPANEDAATPPSTEPSAHPPLVEAATLSIEARQMIESIVQTQVADLRRGFSAALDLQSERLLGDVRAAVTALVPPPAEPQPPLPPSPAPWLIAFAASLAAAVLGFLWWRETQLSEQLVARQTATAQQSVTQLTAMREVSTSIDSTRATALTPAARDIILTVPYGEPPLAGERLEVLRTLLDDLAGSGFRGAVTITNFPGRFCLNGAPTEGFAPALDATLSKDCSLVGNPFDDALPLAQREPVQLANLIGSVRTASAGAVEVELANGVADAVVTPYPDAGDTLTAGEWNRAAAGNNRVEIRVQPSS